ncbi:MAG: hypothetical protein RIC95_08210 [Vicingaceae bacterium]
MKKLLTFCAAILLIVSVSIAQGETKDQIDTLTYSDNFDGKNLFVRNPFGGDDLGFSVKVILLNGKEIEADLDQTAFEVKLAENGIKPDEEYEIQLIHMIPGKPDILNAKH